MTSTTSGPRTHPADQGEPASTLEHAVPQTDLAALVRSLRGVPSRREVLLGLAVAGVGLAGLPERAEATPTRRKKLKPVKPNQYGCLEVTDPCRRHSQCCSGICTGQPGRKRCRAHGTGSCSQSGLGVCTATQPDLLHCNSDLDCFCFRTTGGSNFCGNWFGYKACATCKRDVDCHALGFPAGSACVPVANGHCTAADCASQLVCMAPCGVEPPVM